VIEERGLILEQIYNVDETGLCGNVYHEELLSHVTRNPLLDSKKPKIV